MATVNPSTRGPVPKRSDRRLGHVSAEVQNSYDTGMLELEEIYGPEAPEWLDGYAREWYDSLRQSGQAKWYTPGDWATAAIIARGVMEFIRKPSAMMLASVLSGMSDLAVTEGARRRLHIELVSEADFDDPDAAAGEDQASEWHKKLGDNVVDVNFGQGAGQ